MNYLNSRSTDILNTRNFIRNITLQQFDSIKFPEYLFSHNYLHDFTIAEYALLVRLIRMSIMVVLVIRAPSLDLHVIFNFIIRMVFFVFQCEVENLFIDFNRKQTAKNYRTTS